MKILKVIALSSLLSCSATQKNWRGNTSIDVGIGGESVNPKYSYPYVGASYYLDYGFSASLGAWTSFNGNVGPYWGANWSFMPFEK